MDLHQLRSFVAVAQSGSMTAAARARHVSQPSLSASIRKLEDALGVVLFDRHGKGASLTPAGRLLLPRARAMLAQADAIETGLADELDQGHGVLRVGAIPTIAPYLLADAIDAVRSVYPTSTVVAHEDYTERLIEMLVTDRLDLAVASTPIAHEDVDVEVIGTEALVAAVREDDPLASAERVGVDELRGCVRVVLGEQHCLGRQVAQYCANRRIAGSVGCMVSQIPTALGLVARGAGVAIVPELVARADSVPGVVYRALARGDAKREISVVRPRGRTGSVLTERFIEACAARLARG